MPAPSDIRYVSRVGRDNWLLVTLQHQQGRQVSLPYGLKVRLSEVKGNQEYFQILEGVNKGILASVHMKGPGQSYLVQEMTRHAAATIRFDLKAQALWYGDKGPIQAFSGVFGRYNSIPRGNYVLQIPDYPHNKTRPEYGFYTPYHNTWFRVGLALSGERFVHVGEISEGCVTVRAFQFNPSDKPRAGFSDLPDLAKHEPGALGMPYPATLPRVGSWTEVYEYLICSRASDESVGKLLVT